MLATRLRRRRRRRRRNISRWCRKIGRRIRMIRSIGLIGIIISLVFKEIKREWRDRHWTISHLTLHDWKVCWVRRTDASAWKFCLVEENITADNAALCDWVVAEPAFEISRIANKDASLSFGSKAAALVLLHIHVRAATKDSEMSNRWFPTIECLVRSHCNHGRGRRAIQDMNESGKSITPEGSREM
jgi:hypothetical protein